MSATFVPDYRELHRKLNKTRGKASSFACVDCGKQAEQWSYDHSDPDEVVGLNGRASSVYSTDLTRYQPRCLPCHLAFDAPYLRKRRSPPPPPPTPEQVPAQCEAALRELTRLMSTDAQPVALVDHETTG